MQRFAAHCVVTCQQSSPCDAMSSCPIVVLDHVLFLVGGPPEEVIFRFCSNRSDVLEDDFE